jgi:hypothetical protein
MLDEAVHAPSPAVVPVVASSPVDRASIR